MPYPSVIASECCKWRNANSGFITNISNPGYDQFRFRLVPINPCVNNPALTPIGPAITTGWSNLNLLNANGITTPGTIYLIQQQARILSNTCQNCSGVNANILGQQTDWGNLCIIGMRNSSSPAVGTPIGCYCTPALQVEDLELTDIEYESIGFSSERMSIVTSKIGQQQILIADLDKANAVGNGYISIHTLTGKVLFEQVVFNHESQIEIDLDQIPELSTGIYLLHVQTNVATFTEKIYIAN